MNFIFEKENTEKKVVLAEHTETYQELFEQINDDLSKAELDKFNTFKNKKRKAEWLAVRITLKKILGKYSEIKYNINGSPYIDGDLYLSISHSNNYIALILSNKKDVGIDVEVLSAKILRTVHKFVSNNELKVFKEIDKIKKSYLNWCCKETLYKIKEKGGYDFKEHFKIVDSELKKFGLKKAIIVNDKIDEHFCLFYQFVNYKQNELLLVWH